MTRRNRDGASEHEGAASVRRGWGGFPGAREAGRRRGRRRRWVVGAECNADGAAFSSLTARSRRRRRRTCRARRRRSCEGVGSVSVASAERGTGAPVGCGAGNKGVGGARGTGGLLREDEVLRRGKLMLFRAPVFRARRQTPGRQGDWGEAGETSRPLGDAERADKATSQLQEPDSEYPMPSSGRDAMPYGEESSVQTHTHLRQSYAWLLLRTSLDGVHDNMGVSHGEAPGGESGVLESFYSAHPVLLCLYLRLGGPQQTGRAQQWPNVAIRLRASRLPVPPLLLLAYSPPARPSPTTARPRLCDTPISRLNTHADACRPRTSQHTAPAGARPGAPTSHIGTLDARRPSTTVTGSQCRDVGRSLDMPGIVTGMVQTAGRRQPSRGLQLSSMPAALTCLNGVSSAIVRTAGEDAMRIVGRALTGEDCHDRGAVDRGALELRTHPDAIPSSVDGAFARPAYLPSQAPSRNSDTAHLARHGETTGGAQSVASARTYSLRPLSSDGGSASCTRTHPQVWWSIMHNGPRKTGGRALRAISIELRAPEPDSSRPAYIQDNVRWARAIERVRAARCDGRTARRCKRPPPTNREDGFSSLPNAGLTTHRLARYHFFRCNACSLLRAHHPGHRQRRDPLGAGVPKHRIAIGCPTPAAQRRPRRCSRYLSVIGAPTRQSRAIAHLAQYSEAGLRSILIPKSKKATANDVDSTWARADPRDARGQAAGT
ncbi:hypothetical protein BD413DRAFT_641924 [Trametes elegans]|nr:hypothetical protein BD413DRAFT_641924 [Trametes elegans]